MFKYVEKQVYSKTNIEMNCKYMCRQNNRLGNKFNLNFITFNYLIINSLKYTQKIIKHIYLN